MSEAELAEPGWAEGPKLTDAISVAMIELDAAFCGHDRTNATVSTPGVAYELFFLDAAPPAAPIAVGG